MESAEQLLRCVEAGGVSPSDLCALGRLQALLLLRDAEGLRGALDAFPQRCALPPGTWLPDPRVGLGAGPRGGAWAPGPTERHRLCFLAPLSLLGARAAPRATQAGV